MREIASAAPGFTVSDTTMTPMGVPSRSTTTGVAPAACASPMALRSPSSSSTSRCAGPLTATLLGPTLPDTPTP
ncbi:Uncharacterised protein [Mycobacteroides abscessus subsp. abscessus]|nr:Uncharacterised protein [Mycobacteroides abscessus subsp. abscessus]